MTWSLRLQYILILIVLVTGAFFPPVWLLLIALVLADKKKGIETNQESYRTTYQPPDTMSGTKARIYSIDYEKYRESPEWHIRRKAVLKRDNYTCRQCKVTDVLLEVHHTTYENIGDEPIEDLVSLCRICHQNQHDHYGYDKTKRFFPLV